MAIPRSSALKINTEAWITFSVAVSLKQNALKATASLLLLPSFLYVKATLPPCHSPSLSLSLLASLKESLTLKAEQQKNGNSSGAPRQGGLCLIIPQSNVTAQRPNNSRSLHRCCCLRDTRGIKIPSIRRNCTTFKSLADFVRAEYNFQDITRFDDFPLQRRQIAPGRRPAGTGLVYLLSANTPHLQLGFVSLCVYVKPATEARISSDLRTLGQRASGVKWGGSGAE